MTLDPVRASMLGKIGMARRWAKTVDPDARRKSTQAARDAQQAKYLARATAMDGGASLPPEQLAERARQLRLADLASMRLKARDARLAA